MITVKKPKTTPYQNVKNLWKTCGKLCDFGEIEDNI
jgi:hypothetical protein